MKQSRKKWFVAAICIIVVLAIGAGVSFFLLKNKKDKT